MRNNAQGRQVTDYGTSGENQNVPDSTCTDANVDRRAADRGVVCRADALAFDRDTIGRPVLLPVTLASVRATFTSLFIASAAFFLITVFQKFDFLTHGQLL